MIEIFINNYIEKYLNKLWTKSMFLEMKEYEKYKPKIYLLLCILNKRSEKYNIFISLCNIFKRIQCESLFIKELFDSFIEQRKFSMDYIKYLISQISNPLRKELMENIINDFDNLYI